MGIYKAEAIVLRSRKLNEADNLITLFSREHGKIHAVAKGVRKPKSRKRGGVQLFTHGKFLLYAGKSLDHITQCESKNSFAKLVGDLELFAHASYLAEIVDGLLAENEPQEEVYLLLLTSLHLLEHHNPELLARAFEVRLANLLGYSPQLTECVHCGKTMPVKQIKFSAALGGVLCPACWGQDSFASRCSLGTLGALQQLQRMDLRRLGVLKLTPEIRREMEKILRLFLSYRLEKRLKALDFLQMISEARDGYTTGSLAATKDDVFLEQGKEAKSWNEDAANEVAERQDTLGRNVTAEN
ncbi:MAG: DNA repair protein RecO [Clostridia bacterium]|nr:DNA repair protein RecO [Clostridia bacterium]